MDRRQLVAGWPRFPELISERASCFSGLRAWGLFCLFHCPGRFTKCQAIRASLSLSAISEPAVDDYHGSLARPQPTVLIWTDVRRQAPQLCVNVFQRLPLYAAQSGILIQAVTHANFNTLKPAAKWTLVFLWHIYCHWINPGCHLWNLLTTMCVGKNNWLVLFPSFVLD